MINIVINGDFYDKNITGVQRYAFEMINALDCLVEKYDNISIEVLVPNETQNLPQLNNIKIVKYGKKRRLLWQQFSLMNYCRKRDAYCVCLCTTVPLLYAKKSICVIHDAATLVHPEFYSHQYLLFNKVFFWSIARKLKRIITVSNFSKKEISKYFANLEDNILVVPSAADHMKKIQLEEDIFEELKITKNSYYYTLSSLSPNKNYKWIIEVAKNNPKSKFVISGMNIDLFYQERFEDIPSNVCFIVYISDGEMAALMKYCKLFLFPTLYEGFGLTPLEAFSLGAKIVVSDIPIMHEIYDGNAVFVDPYKYDVDLQELLYRTDKLEKKAMDYSWEKSAVIFLKMINNLEG